MKSIKKNFLKRFQKGEKGFCRVGQLTLLFLWVVLPGKQLGAQEEAATWYFGQAGVHFSDGEIRILTDGPEIQGEGLSAVSDCGGRLLFYSDGENLRARTHQIMLNGDMAGGHYSSTQGSLIIPHPGICNHYYVFTLDAKESGFQQGLRYSIVDMDGDGGFGEVVVKNQSLYPGASEKMTAVLHADGVSIWVITHRMGSNEFVAYRISENGLQNVPVVSESGIPFVTATQAIGQMKASPDGRLLAMASVNLKMVQLFDFDSATGKVSNARIIDGDTFERPGLYGLEFSPSGRFLYTSNHSLDYLNESGLLYQLDLESGEALQIMESATVVGSNKPPSDIRGLQLGPDGRIYVARSLSQHLGVIRFPDQAGQACGYVDEGLSLEGRTAYWSLPNFLVSWFDPDRIVPSGPGITFKSSCLEDPVYFFPENIEQETFRSWIFGDGSVGYGVRGYHQYKEAGDYLVGLVYETGCCRDTAKKWLTLESCPTDNTEHLYVPNIFTPDGDGVNDHLFVYGAGGTPFEWQIFDRWGHLVFQSADPQMGWDGRKQGELLPAGIYVYLLKIDFQVQKNVVLKGSVFLRR